MRDWKGFLGELDGIEHIEGLCFKGSCHWFAYCRRADLPLEVAAYLEHDVWALPHPGDVMCLTKQYMSSESLSQPVFRFCSAGASFRLPPDGPVAWKARTPFTQAYVADLENLCRKVVMYFPAKAASVQYIRNYLQTPLAPPVPPDCLAIMRHRYLQQGPSSPCWEALQRAAVPEVEETRVVQAGAC